MKEFRVHFCLEALETQAIDRHCKNAHFNAPDPEDCLLLHYEFTGLVKLGQVISKLPANANVTFLKDDLKRCIISVWYRLAKCQERNQLPKMQYQHQMARHLERNVLFGCHTFQWHRIENLLVLVGSTICISWTMSVSLSNLPVWVSAENKTLCKNVV